MLIDLCVRPISGSHLVLWSCILIVTLTPLLPPILFPSLPQYSSSSTEYLAVGLCTCSHQLLDEISLVSLMRIPIPEQFARRKSCRENVMWVCCCPNPSTWGLVWLEKIAIHALCPPLLEVYARVNLLDTVDFHCTRVLPGPKKAPNYSHFSKYLSLNTLDSSCFQPYLSHSTYKTILFPPF